MINKIQSKIKWAAERLTTIENLAPDLPWRIERTPYKVFVAELLLIRTRSDVVASTFPEVISKYPNIQALANAQEAELGKLIEPLGLKKRVSYIIKAAKHIQEMHRGEIPDNVDDLLKVPGLGIYSSPAIATFAFDKKLVPADVNIFRFMSRFTGLDIGHKTKGSKELIEHLPLLAEEKTGLRAEQLLDFTRLICRPRNPKCAECPLRKRCKYFMETNNGR